MFSPHTHNYVRSKALTKLLLVIILHYVHM